MIAYREQLCNMQINKSPIKYYAHQTITNIGT